MHVYTSNVHIQPERDGEKNIAKKPVSHIFAIHNSVLKLKCSFCDRCENMANVKERCQPLDDCGQIANYTRSNIVISLLWVFFVRLYNSIYFLSNAKS